MLYFVFFFCFCCDFLLFFFFFKQKTAYEMRISDWSSDVCSSDLDPVRCTPLRSPQWQGAQGTDLSALAGNRDVDRKVTGTPTACARRAHLRQPIWQAAGRVARAVPTRRLCCRGSQGWAVAPVQTCDTAQLTARHRPQPC